MRSFLSRLLDTILKSSVARVFGDKIWAIQARRIVDPSFFSANHIFVVGCGHSGTSVLLARLDNHSIVSAIPGESRFFQRDPLRRAIILRHWVSQWKPGRVLAEKTPIHVRHCYEIKQVFPNARIIGICRHPLDVIASLYLRHNQRLETGIDRWNRDNSFVINEKNNGNIDYVVKYEEFVTNPDDVFRKIQIACGLTVEDGLCSMTHEKRNWYARESRPASTHEQKRQAQINQPIFDGRGKYRDVLSPEQIAIIMSETAEIAAILGYSDCP